jgi:tetratricopeptide (TPR) repeat protein
MVEWPWVLFWQVGLLCPVLWLLGIVWQRRFSWLGNRLDWVVGFLLVGLLLSTLLSPFPRQAHWYGWAVLCFLAALYALNSWLVPSRRIGLLIFQGYLALAFILVSLLLWSSQTLVPELARLQEFRQLGVSLPFDFANIELRNGFPIGHQNYVAGYLVLVLPLFLGLGIVQTGWQRWVWLTGVCLGLVNLYTTSSRGGWLGVALLLAIAVAGLLWCSQLPRRWVGLIGLAGLVGLALLVLGNNRLRSLVTGIFTGQGEGELAYRLITVTTGWRMGLSHLLTGAGPGNVPLLYQRYRPTWAGREAELHYQLHSTPAQLWAELGLWSVLTAVGAIALLTVLILRWLRSLNLQPTVHPSTPPILIGCILSGLTAYVLFSLTDYQLDNIPISGVLVLYLAVLAAEFRNQKSEVRSQESGVGDEEPEARKQKDKAPTTKNSLTSYFPPLSGLGLLAIILVWLVPIQQAWMLSSQGFRALSQNDLNTFAQRLTRSHQLVPWEPYYSYQLGWNLGNAGLQMSDPKQQQILLQDGVSWLQRGIQAAPDQEFGYSNLAWLQINRDPKAASQAFARAAQLVPAKRGAFYGLGLSLLAQGNSELAIAALSLEALRDPLLITSPLWGLPELQPLYQPVLSRMEREYTAMLATTTAQNSPLLTSQLHQSRGGLRWWVGDLKGSRADLDTYGTPLSQAVLNLAQGQPVESLSEIETTAGGLAIAAWLNPDKRQNLLNQAWIKATRTLPPPEILQQLVESMTRSSTLDQWLKQHAPSRQYRRERTGFGVLNRHADGPAPIDFLTVVENIPMTIFFEALMPSFKYAPELDQILQPERDILLGKVS